MPLRANAYGGVGVVLRLWKENSGVTNPLVGTINLYQVGEWAASHVARHYDQARRALPQRL